MRPTTGGIPLAALEVVPKGPTPRSPLRPDRRAPRQTTTAHEGVCVMREQNSELAVYSSSSSASSSPPFAAAAALARLRLTRPARAPPYGEVSEKSMCWRWVKGEWRRRGGGRGGVDEVRDGEEARWGGRGRAERQHAARARQEERRRERTFCESRRTTNDGTLTICLPTLRGEEVRAGSAPATKLALLGGAGSTWDAPDVALADEDASVVDRLGEAALEDLGLEAALEEVLDLEGEDVVEAHALLVEDADADQAVCKDESQCGFIGRADEVGRRESGTHRRMRALPSKRRFGSFSSSLRSSRAARRIFERMRAILQISCLFLRPYSPASLSSASRRADSNGRRGTCGRGRVGCQLNRPVAAWLLKLVARRRSRDGVRERGESVGSREGSLRGRQGTARPPARAVDAFERH